jgi:predicted phage terminase large subunit-like protein
LTKQVSTAELKRGLRTTQRMLATQRSRDEFLEFVKFMMPDYEDEDDPTMTGYDTTPLSLLLSDMLTKVEKGLLLRGCVSVGPQYGKSLLISVMFIAWYSGRNPRKHTMLATYNQDKADEWGDMVRAVMESPRYKMVFPKHALRKGGQAKDRLVTAYGGIRSFVGIGGSGSGKPADVLIVDDPIKNDEEAQSPTRLNAIWAWLNSVGFARARNFTAIVIVHTRWATDDPIGRLLDPDHPEHDPEIAAEWVYVNLPAVVTDPRMGEALGLKLEKQTEPLVIAQFGDKPMAPLWDAQKSLPFLAGMRRYAPRIFDSLYMGKPAPDEGDYFKAQWLLEYDLKDLPERLEIYAASDHAVSMKQDRDRTVLGCVGIDEQHDIWVLPDLVWEQMETDKTVEEILKLMKVHNPFMWWMESELISKSFGPFLRKRMEEEKIYCAIDPVTPHRDKKTRARSIQGRMSMGKVHFPKFAHWWPDARVQLLRFPFAANDDFVDWLAHIGMGLVKEYAPNVQAKGNVIALRPIDRILRASKLKAEKQKRDQANAGW